MNFNTDAENIKSKRNGSKLLKLVGTDGNAWALMGKAQEFNRKNKLYSKEDFETIMKECTSGGYDHLLQTLMYFFNVG